ncbi:MAG: prepilin-type N-terminal cleavage/methylation domain-containing protein [Rubrivivax sp.]
MKTSTACSRLAWNRQRGVSLIEALVAMAVMAIGMLGVVGLQATLRSNADVTRQRAEAVRIAQADIERWRSFTTLDMPSVVPTPPAPAHIVAFNDMQSGTVNISGDNASYVLTRTVSAVTGTVGRNVSVTVGWTDRTGTAQNVTLTSQIAGILPEVSAALVLPSRTLSNKTVKGRNGSIPVSALDQGDGTSRFSVPGTSSTQWVFNNTSGLITSICNGGTCTVGNFALLAGYLRFALPVDGLGDPVQPSHTLSPPNASETPLSPVPTGGNFSIRVNTTAPAIATVGCAHDEQAGYVAYYCAMPLAPTGAQWSGTPEAFGFAIASDADDDNDNEFKVCRYTPDPTSDTTTDPINHPRTYTSVGVSLVNQNYLVIRAGYDNTSFSCPLDNAATPDVDGDTRLHQPSPN